MRALRGKRGRFRVRLAIRYSTCARSLSGPHFLCLAARYIRVISAQPCLRASEFAANFSDAGEALSRHQLVDPSFGEADEFGNGSGALKGIMGGFVLVGLHFLSLSLIHMGFPVFTEK